MERKFAVAADFCENDLLYNERTDELGTYTGRAKGGHRRPDGLRTIELMEIAVERGAVTVLRSWMPEHCRKISTEQADQIRARIKQKPPRVEDDIEII